MVLQGYESTKVDRWTWATNAPRDSRFTSSNKYHEVKKETSTKINTSF